MCRDKMGHWIHKLYVDSYLYVVKLFDPQIIADKKNVTLLILLKWKKRKDFEAETFIHSSSLPAENMFLLITYFS